MGADQVAAFRPAIREVFAAAGQGEEWCTTFGVSTESDRWVQVTPDTLNIAYPYAEQPIDLLQRVGVNRLTDLTLVDWKPHVYATFNYSKDLSERELARLVDQLFILVLECTDPDYPVDVELFPLPPDIEQID